MFLFSFFFIWVTLDKVSNPFRKKKHRNDSSIILSFQILQGIALEEGGFCFQIIITAFQFCKNKICWDESSNNWKKPKDCLKKQIKLDLLQPPLHMSSQAVCQDYFNIIAIHS